MSAKSSVFCGFLCALMGLFAQGLSGGNSGSASATQGGGSLTFNTASTRKVTTRPATGAASQPVTTRKSIVVKNQPFVETAAIVVTVKLMDPEKGKKPREFHGEAGSCETKFGSGYGFESTPAEFRQEKGEWVASMRLQAPAAKVNLAVELWIPEGAGAWLIDHEETHRAISERVYSEGVVELSAYLKTANGRVFEGRGKTKPAANLAARRAALEEFNEVYLRVLPGRQMFLNGEFDRLSEHGRDQSKSAGEWMKVVFENEKKAKEKK